MIDLAILKSVLVAEAGFLFSSDWELFTHEELIHMCDILDYPNIQDRYLCDIPELYPYIKWERLEKMQAIRIVTRHPELLDRIDLKKYTYKIKEIWYFVQIDHTRLFTYFDFDFKFLTKEDAYFLLCLGKEDFLSLIDLQAHSFNHIEVLHIIKAYDCRREVILNMDYKQLNSSQITDIIIETGEDLLDLFALDKLTTLNWLELLAYRPEFLEKCDFNKFINGDPFNLVQLVTMFKNPDLFFLIKEINTNEITAFGWEKLLIYHPDKAVEICDFKKLRENNWIEILKENPHLEMHKIN